jgi:soluble lytic murein transglycosylase
MRELKIWLPFVLIGVSILACTGKIKSDTPVEVKFQDTATAGITPSQTPAPTTTPIPTLIPIVQIESADRAYFNGDWEMAAMEYQAVYEASYDSDTQEEIQAAALLGIGRARYQMAHYESALDILSQLINTCQDCPQLAAAYFISAEVYEALSLYGEAADAYGNYLKLRSGLIDSYVLEWQGDALVASGDPIRAIDVYQSAIAAPRLGANISIELKIANAYAALGDYDTALVAYQDVYTRTSSDYTKSQVDILMGNIYNTLGQMDQAYEVYLDAVENYPLSNDSYQALIVLVDSGYPVSEFDRGLVDYFAGQYNLAIAAFDRYLSISTENAGTVYYYKGLAYRALDNPDSAINSWDVLINSYQDDGHWDDALEEIAFTQWAYLDEYPKAIQTLLDFVKIFPTHSRAPEFLFDAAQIAERDRNYGKAAGIWERLPFEYPSSELVPRGIFLAGISYYRALDFTSALETFEWSLNSSVDPGMKSAAYFWMAKSYQALGDDISAETFLNYTANEDPTGYYSERARDLLVGVAPFEPPVMFDLAFDIEAEREEAEIWMRTNFSIPDAINLSEPGLLLNDLRFVRGTELWNLGLYEMARSEFESLRADISLSPMDNYRLANYLSDLGLYRSAIFAARQVLDLRGMDDGETLSGPIYFNHLRFGSYYKDLVLPAAEANGFHPLFLFSVIRQESLFEGFVRSSAGARGLMQIMPSTADGIISSGDWPPGYSSGELYRPKVSIALGVEYLDTQRNYFDGNLYATLAAYNAGPGNTLIWWNLADGDVDLFLEIIRYEETRNYIKGIYEVFTIYRLLYDRSP